VEHRRLGRSGCVVSSLWIGTMTFVDETDESGAFEQLDRFVEAGGNLVHVVDRLRRYGVRVQQWSLAGEPAGGRHQPRRARHQGPVPDW
jgi:hypothetical protein